MSAEPRYFGQPGHCYSIDGDWWHEPGKCPAKPDCRGGCCGVDEPARSVPTGQEASE